MLSSTLPFGILSDELWVDTKWYKWMLEVFIWWTNS